MTYRNAKKRTTVSAAVAAAVLTGFAGFDRARFANPENIHSPAYFWLWNDTLETEKLKSQIDDMHAHGMRSICAHPFPVDFRPGTFESRMSPDYMTEGYLLAVSNVFDYAASLGMNVWLYDEGGWPSGGVCGQIAADDADGRFKQRFLSFSGGKPRVVAAPYAKKGRAYPSLIEKGLTSEFIRRTHDEYEKYTGHHFGKAVKFTFMDEPTTPRERGGLLPWAADFAEEFRRRKGYDILPYTPRIAGRRNSLDAGTAARALDYYDVLSDLFEERFLGEIRSWDAKRGLLSSGHFNGEDVPERCATYGYGSLMRSYRAMDVPGIDVIWRQLFPETACAPAITAPFPRYASSAAHQNGGMLAMSETFGVFGDSCTPEQLKWVLDYQMVRGINMFVIAYYLVSDEGQWQLLFGPHGGPLAPWWDMERPFFEYIARTSAMLASGRPAVDTAVYFDDRAFWLGGTEADIAAKLHYSAASLLDRMNCEYEFVDDASLADATVSDGVLKVGAMSYSTFVLPSSKWMSAAARKKLDAFKTQGGKVLTCESISGAKPACRIRGGSGEHLRVAKRTSGGETLYFIVNESRFSVNAALEFDEKGPVVHADAWSGDFVAVPRVGGAVRWKFTPFSSAMFVVNGKANRPAPPVYAERGRVLDSGWTMQRIVSHSLGEKRIEVTRLDDKAVPAKLGDWRQALGDHFSGQVRYECRFNCDEERKVLLDLGQVCWTCEVRLNGKVLPGRFFGPFRWETEIRKGENVLEVTVANTMANALCDTVKRARAAASGELPPHPTYDSRQKAFDRENNESGLMGPVVVFGLKDSPPVK